MKMDEMKALPNYHLIELRKGKWAVPAVALKVTSVTACACPVCGKRHRYFWRLPDDMGLAPDEPSAPYYTSRRWCQAKSITK